MVQSESVLCGVHAVYVKFFVLFCELIEGSREESDSVTLVFVEMNSDEVSSELELVSERAGEWNCASLDFRGDTFALLVAALRRIFSAVHLVD